MSARLTADARDKGLGRGAASSASRTSAITQPCRARTRHRPQGAFAHVQNWAKLMVRSVLALTCRVGRRAAETCGDGLGGEATKRHGAPPTGCRTSQAVRGHARTRLHESDVHLSRSDDLVQDARVLDAFLRDHGMMVAKHMCGWLWEVPRAVGGGLRALRARVLRRSGEGACTTVL